MARASVARTGWRCAGLQAGVMRGIACRKDAMAAAGLLATAEKAAGKNWVSKAALGALAPRSCAAVRLTLKTQTSH